MAVLTSPAPTTTVDIAGTAWPLYKLEALAAALVIAALLLLVVGSAQLAVLVAATVATVRWTVGATRTASRS
ncbi:hypothetical protein [Nocardia sp. NPDC058666]|uniref:hypothetical protein n=1 Tax=Nocardia sp. NPDC058666 TaxID=3346587 RepID=UPI00365A39A6